MLKISIPKTCLNEQHYILSIMLGEFLGLDFDVTEHNESFIKITDPSDKVSLTLNADFFQNSGQAWLQEKSMPVLPLQTWSPSGDGLHVNLIEESIPIIYGQAGLIKELNHWHLNLDIFGSAFFMLSRYEELITQTRDKHDRFPATASIAFKANFLERPIVDEYLEILWACMHQLWPELERKQRQAENFITCDIDWPFNPSLYSVKTMIRTAGSALIKERLIRKTAKILFRYLFKKCGFGVEDDYREAINWIMEVNEKEGSEVSFYFITHFTSKFDSNLDFNSHELRSLLREIHQRGHKVGLHPGYETFNNSDNFSKSVSEFKRILQEEGIEQSCYGGRQHFLLWNAAITPHLWEQHGFDYDSTLGFADKSGFRCGTGHEFTMYNLINRKRFKLKQRPLISMECTVIEQRYEGLGYSNTAVERFKYFKNIVHKYGGNFTLLWHNSHFENKQDKEFYLELIRMKGSD